MARGGRRAGNRGTPYPNRTDLQTALPQTAPGSLPYGERGQLIAAQRTIPMAPAPVPGGGAPQAGGPPTTPPPAGPPPGAQPLLRPTERPNEPVTHGLPIGPGAGPEALGPLGQQAAALGPGGAGQNVGGLLQSLAAAPFATDQVRQLASFTAQGNK